ncbi:hypothetical protein AVEN_157070-1 [Araneus ventricosus]|uniref:Tc1-like transposase DDE domain-containing protein n=1 Tax=Araneus ventricosus TaxID=182803 RepID=A0A4Y2GP29_ARAVE|nr:hypothetical protein AVEN_157070-1 [Araneus ventricosus]
MSAQVSSSSSDHDSKLRCPSQNCSRVASKRDARPRWPRGKVSALGPEGSKPDSTEIRSSLRFSVWFQHDGAPPHYTNDVRKHLNVTFGQNWIGRGSPVHWPARSPDLSSLDFCWGQMKTMVYESPIDSVQDLVVRISVAAGEMRDTPGIF